MCQVKGDTLVSQKDARMLHVLYRPHATTVLRERVDYVQTAGIKKLAVKASNKLGSTRTDSLFTVNGAISSSHRTARCHTHPDQNDPRVPPVRASSAFANPPFSHK
jgi:hypothetical protein